jgi:hypothetical protein
MSELGVNIRCNGKVQGLKVDVGVRDKKIIKSIFFLIFICTF